MAHESRNATAAGVSDWKSAQTHEPLRMASVLGGRWGGLGGGLSRGGGGGGGGKAGGDGGNAGADGCELDHWEKENFP